MSGSHSTTMAEERLFPSAQDHKGTFTTITKHDDRRLSAAVIGEGPGNVEPIGAFEVSQRKRILQIAVAVIYCLFAAGIVFGYAALKPVLIAEKVYREYCSPEEIEENVRVCYQQELRLNFMFTVAAVATNVCALLVGTILDQFGPRVAGIIGSWLLAAGLAGFGFSKSITFVDPYPISYLLMALGGPFIFIPSFHLANAFPRRSGLILSMLTGAFDASSIIFLVYRVLYQHSSTGITLRTWFLSYLIIPVFIFLAQVFIMPLQSYKTAAELTQQAAVEQNLLDHEDTFVTSSDTSSSRNARRERRESVVSNISALLGPTPEKLSKQTSKQQTSGVWGVMHNATLPQQLTSFWFWGIAGFTIVQMTRINYFVATIRPQYEFLLGSYDSSVRINSFFDIALPIGGLLAIPFIGVVLDSLSTFTVLTTLVTIASTIGILGLIPGSWVAAYMNILLFCAYRPFYYTVVSDYCAKVFGVRTFGKIYGAVICMAGLFNLSQAALDALVHRVFGGDPRPVNAALLVLAVIVGMALCAFVAREGRRARRRLLGEEARRAGEREEERGEAMETEGLLGEERERGYEGV
ncbi:MFS general substrate transporter [Ascodesmis nigricans]|uniref:MFS general substrate transporter n=1 Tax=Ascodesmis nigricans TaxID=341454 RepID=A0A4S2MVU2_9PEZI|nr:MFS general substrate transporter [Ascodesmis nigricans]